MSDPLRISPEDTRERVSAGSAMLVCAYPEDEKFNMVHLEGAIPMSEFTGKADSLQKDQEIIFYCA